MDAIVGGRYSADQSAALSRACCLEHNTVPFSPEVALLPVSFISSSHMLCICKCVLKNKVLKNTKSGTFYTLSTVYILSPCFLFLVF